MQTCDASTAQSASVNLSIVAEVKSSHYTTAMDVYWNKDSKPYSVETNNQKCRVVLLASTWAISPRFGNYTIVDAAIQDKLMMQTTMKAEQVLHYIAQKPEEDFNPSKTAAPPINRNEQRDCVKQFTAAAECIDCQEEFFQQTGSFPQASKRFMQTNHSSAGAGTYLMYCERQHLWVPYQGNAPSTQRHQSVITRRRRPRPTLRQQ